jgi:hypothetical protein
MKQATVALLLVTACCGAVQRTTTVPAIPAGAVELPPGWSTATDRYEGIRPTASLIVELPGGQRISFAYDQSVCSNAVRAEQMLRSTSDIPADPSRPGWQQVQDLTDANARWACHDTADGTLQVDAESVDAGDWTRMNAVIDLVTAYTERHHALPTSVVSSSAA